MKTLLLLLPLISEPDVARWVAAQGGRVVQDQQGRITAVDLTQTWITDADLARLSGLRHIRKLTLAETRITVIDKGGVIFLVPERPLRTYRGIARATNPKGLRDKKDRH